MDLLIATRNDHKVREIGAILDLPGLRLMPVSAYPGLPEVEEDGDTFEANAIKKAVTIALATGTWAMADDSGLVVDALGGAPGVFSARYAGSPADYEANNRKLLAALRGVANRRAAFHCVLALAGPDGTSRTVEGRCAGHIIDTVRGTAGFGYDPLFVPDGYTDTFAEMPSALKNRISHRALALATARHAWRDLLAGV